LQCEQWKLTQLIKDQLDTMPHVTVHLNTKVEGVDQTADGVTTRLSTDGQAHEVRSDYLIGADGAWSAVRKSQNIEFEGFTYPERFLVVSTDFEYADHLPKLSYVNYCSDPKEWCVLLRVPTLWRVLFPTKVEETDDEVLGDESVQRRLQGLLPQPVIGVPVSVGYGVSAGGQAALHGMLASCAPGLTVVNIDNGYGAAMAALRILRGSGRPLHTL
jgi:3-(3-hydroxy-phenyl)propionate hydroxylase